MPRWIPFLFLGTLFLSCEEPGETGLTGLSQAEPVMPQPTPAGENPANNLSLSYLALGDSYTIGESVEEEERFPVQLSRELNTRGYRANPPVIIARTGWTTGNLLKAIGNEKPGTSYDLVSLLIGVNNQYRGENIELYREQFTQLLDSAIRYAGGLSDHVFVLSIPDYGVTPFAASRDPEKIRQEIDLYNTINREISLKKLVNYVDITGISREAANDLSLLAPDQLHPSGTMYARWVEALLGPVLEILERH